AADDDAVGVEAVVYGRTLPQELGVGHDEHVGATQSALDDTGGPDRDGGLVDDHRLGVEDGTDLTGGGLDVAHVGRAVGALGGGDAQEDELGARRGPGGAQHERQPSPVEPLPHQLFQPRLHDGDLAPG